MLSVILMILKIIGIAIGGIIAFLVLFVLLLLFLPFVYRIKVDKEEKIEGRGSISWLFPVFYGKIKYSQTDEAFSFDQIYYELYLLGIPLLKLGKWIDKQKEKWKTINKKTNRKTNKKANKKTAKPIAKKKDKQVRTDSSKQSREEPVKVSIEEIETTPPIPKNASSELDKKSPSERKSGKQNSVFYKISKLWKKIKSIIGKIVVNIKKIYGIVKIVRRNFSLLIEKWKKESTQSALKEIYKEIKLLLKHIRPRRIKGFIQYGSNDPAKTGQAMAVFGIFYGFYGDKIRIHPDFENEVLEGKIQMSGIIQLFVIVQIIYRLYRDENIRIVISDFSNKEDK